MEAKTIFYLFILIGYGIFSLIKNAKDTPKKAPLPQPKKRSTFDEALEEFQTRQQQNKQATGKLKNPKPTSPKPIFVQENLNPAFEEGKSAFKTYSETTFKEGGTQIAFVDEMPNVDDIEASINFDMRSAIIHSIILERKF